MLQISVDIGSNKLENEYADFTFNPLHFLQSSFSALQPPKVIISLIGAHFLVCFSHPSFVLNNLNSLTLLQYNAEERLENGLLLLLLY